MTIPGYGEKSYWEQRYKTGKDETFEWYGDWATAKAVVQNLKVNKDHSILHVGCGNSTLAEDMYTDGYRNHRCVDIVERVIGQMAKRSAESRPEIKYEVMDITDNAFKSHMDSEFQLILDKGCLDTVVCGTGVSENVSTMLGNIWGSLTETGYFVIFSYGTPEERLSLLDSTDKKFEVKVKVLKKNSLEVALEGGQYDLEVQDYQEGKHYENCYFVYICQKADEEEKDPV